MHLVADEQGGAVAPPVWGCSPISGKQQAHGIAELYRVLGNKTATGAW